MRDKKTYNLLNASGEIIYTSKSTITLRRILSMLKTNRHKCPKVDQIFDQAETIEWEDHSDSLNIEEFFSVRSPKTVKHKETFTIPKFPKQIIDKYTKSLLELAEFDS